MITEGAEGADDVHTLAQEASTEHAWLMAMLNKVAGLMIMSLTSTYLTNLCLLTSLIYSYRLNSQLNKKTCAG